MAIIDWAKEGSSITDTSGLFDSLGSVLDAGPALGKKSSPKSRKEEDIEDEYLNLLNKMVQDIDIDLLKLWDFTIESRKEWFGLIVENKDKNPNNGSNEACYLVINEQIGEEHSVTVAIDEDFPEHQLWVGDIHTHPIKSAFSDNDINNIRTMIKHKYTFLIQSEHIRYALIISDEEKADKFFKSMSEEELKDIYDYVYFKKIGDKVGHQLATEIAVRTIIKRGEYGILFYSTEGDSQQKKFKRINNERK